MSQNLTEYDLYRVVQGYATTTKYGGWIEDYRTEGLIRIRDIQFDNYIYREVQDMDPEMAMNFAANIENVYLDGQWNKVQTLEGKELTAEYNDDGQIVMVLDENDIPVPELGNGIIETSDIESIEWNNQNHLDEILDKQKDDEGIDR